MIRPTHDADLVNRVVNDPAVRPYLGGDGPLDMSEAVADPNNWFLMGDHGGFALIETSPHVREVHTFILKEGRGKAARSAAAEGIAFAKENGVKALWTRIPPKWPHIGAYAYGMGMRPTGETIDTLGEEYAVYRMEIG